MTKKDLIKQFEEFPDDAELEMVYYDFYTEHNSVPIVSYNKYSNKIYISPGENIYQVNGGIEI